MADSISQIAASVTQLAHSINRCAQHKGDQFDSWGDDLTIIATRLRALSPVGGDCAASLEAIMLEHADGLAAAAAALKAALAASPQQEPGAPHWGNLPDGFDDPELYPPTPAVESGASGQTLAGAGEGVSLPELPEPAGHSGIPAFSEFYTADQMREYARRAREVG